MKEDPRQPRTEDREPTGRKRRVGLGGTRLRLDFPKRPGYVRRVVSDYEGRLQLALETDWDYVYADTLVYDPNKTNPNMDLGSRISMIVDKGTGQRGYLMEIREDYYHEDQLEKLKPVEEIERQIRKGSLKSIEQGYVPKGNKFETND